MAGRFLCGLCCSAMVACSIGSLAQSAGRDAAGTDPRNFDATEYGERVVLGPKWLFAPGDNPTWATPAFDDSGWTTISTDKQLLEYDIGNNSYVWYRMHLHLSPHT